jgi:DNA replication protein DnaC
LYQLTLAHADGSYPKLLAQLSRFQLLILDDWLRDPLTLAQARDLLEVLDDRDARAATLVATQVPVTDWHQRLPDPTLGDAVLDRLVQTAYRLELRGESRRKSRAPVVASATS